ncbi:MAG: hypothetical protein HY362_00620 [Candidatus Aenigmarchaeota archaeon]|nr:hypothetical protein [Candidatus Aenigmarchaeota archaeon]
MGNGAVRGKVCLDLIGVDPRTIDNEGVARVLYTTNGGGSPCYVYPLSLSPLVRGQFGGNGRSDIAVHEDLGPLRKSVMGDTFDGNAGGSRNLMGIYLKPNGSGVELHACIFTEYRESLDVERLVALERADMGVRYVGNVILNKDTREGVEESVRSANNLPRQTVSEAQERIWALEVALPLIRTHHSKLLGRG